VLDSLERSNLLQLAMKKRSLQFLQRSGPLRFSVAGRRSRKQITLLHLLKTNRIQWVHYAFAIS
jgi:hypothetical protein